MKAKYPVTYEGHPTPPVEGDMLVWNGSEWVTSVGVENVGSSGQGVYKGMSGNMRQFKKITTASAHLTVTTHGDGERIFISHVTTAGSKHIPNNLAENNIPKATGDGSLEDSIISESGGVMEVQGDIIANVD